MYQLSPSSCLGNLSTCGSTGRDDGPRRPQLPRSGRHGAAMSHAVVGAPRRPVTDTPLLRGALCRLRRLGSRARAVWSRHAACRMPGGQRIARAPATHGRRARRARCALHGRRGQRGQRGCCCSAELRSTGRVHSHSARNGKKNDIARSAAALILWCRRRAAGGGERRARRLRCRSAPARSGGRASTASKSCSSPRVDDHRLHLDDHRLHRTPCAPVLRAVQNADASLICTASICGGTIIGHKS